MGPLFPPCPSPLDQYRGARPRAGGGQAGNPAGMALACVGHPLLGCRGAAAGGARGGRGAAGRAGPPPPPPAPLPRMGAGARGMALGYVLVLASLFVTPLLFWVWLLPVALALPITS